MTFIRAIPLPLRIAGIFLLGLVLFQFVGKMPSAVFVSAALAFWSVVLVTWVYDQGWVNPLARVPVVSGVLGFLTNRKALSGPKTRTSTERAVAPPGELDESERQALFAKAQQSLADLHGNDAAKEIITQRIVAPARENPENPFGSSAPATIIMIAGPRGVGKTTLAHTLANLLVGVGAIKTASVVTVRPTDIRTGEFASAIELARSKTKSAKKGTLLIDDADWLLADDPYGAADTPGNDFGMTLVETASDTADATLVVATMSVETLGRLKEDAKHSRWLGKLARREVVLQDLDDEGLLTVLEAELGNANWRIESEDAATAARRMLSDLRDRKTPNFDNAIACRRAAEKLVEITTEDFEEKARKRVIGREAIRIADEEME